MKYEKHSDLSPEDIEVLQEAEKMLSARCGQEMALVAYTIR